jgi:SMODS-associated and fused to various effectors sensor domain
VKDAMASRKKAKKSSASLLSPGAMGGIIAGEGFDFQTRYAACHLPIWLLDGLHQLLFEGTGDIDVRFLRGGLSTRVHIQVKDHEVSLGDFKKVIAHFRAVDQEFPPGTYKQFTLACPALATKVRPIETGLTRLRGASPFYDDIRGALVPTKEEVDDRLRKNDLGSFVDFIHDKVYIEIGYGDLCHDDRAIELFVARLLNHPEYAGKVRAMVQPAFAEITRAIASNKGMTLERGTIDEILRAAVLTTLVPEVGITLWVQNWTQETFDPPADYVLDWSAHFDRLTRHVPSEVVWNTELLPQLIDLKKKILAEKKERLIRFRGKCALSTGLAVGAAFPAVGGWTFEIPQPPMKDPWRSDAPATSAYQLDIETIDGDLTGSDLVIGLNIRGDGRGDIMRFIESTGQPPRLFAFVAPPSQGAQSIGGAGDARAFAVGVREHLGQLLKTHQLRKTRLFFYGPFALSVLLGQQLTSVGEIQLFEYQDPGYVSSCSLKT